MAHHGHKRKQPMYVYSGKEIHGKRAGQKHRLAIGRSPRNRIQGKEGEA
jgi:hypothetical protein